MHFHRGRIRRRVGPGAGVHFREAESRACSGTFLPLWALTTSTLVAFLSPGPFFPHGSEAWAFEPDLDDSFVLQAARAFGTRLEGSLSTTYVDAAVETKNTGGKETDQRYGGTGRFDASLSPSSAFALRAFARARYSDELRQDSLSTDRKVTQKHVRYNGAVDVSFVASQGLEVFVGAAAFHAPKSKRSVALTSVASESEYEASTLYAPRVGLLKRTSSFAAGGFYGLMAEGKRNFTRKTGTESDNGKEYVTIPSLMGAAARFTPGADFELEGEIAFVRIGESEEKTDQGAPLHRDYFRIRFGGLFPALPGQVNVHSFLTHRTLSYNDQGFMTMENIPTTHLEIQGVTAGTGARAYLGLGFTYAADEQSIPELNAEFTLKAYTLKLGGVLPM